MSYRTFKRVLGETNLERKCRWWFGLSLIVMLSVSFTWYGQQTNKLVDERIQTLSQELVRAGWQKRHMEQLAVIEGGLSQENEKDEESESLYSDLADSSMGLAQDFIWEPILPPAADGRPLPPEYTPQDAEERDLLVKWSESMARADDGQFLIVYGTGPTRLETLDVMARTFSGRHLQHPKVTHHPAAMVTVESDRPLALHADGEWLGRWPSVTFQIVPGALHVIVPSDGAPAEERRP